MQMTIDFPNIGIHFKHVGKAFTIFGFDIAYYGILIGLGILAGIMITIYEARRTKQNPENYIDLAIFTVIFSIIGARIFYVMFSWDMYKGHFLSIFNIRKGGLAIYGGIIAGIITVFVFARLRNLSAPLLLDTSVIGLVTGQIIGRWGSFFNREAFGEYSDGLFAMRLPVDAVRSSDITELMKQKLEIIDGVSYIQVRPAFLYESLWCLLLLVLLLLYRQNKKYKGELFLVYLAGYGLGRFFIESIRTDQLKIAGLGWAVSKVLSLLLIIVSVIFIVKGRKEADVRRKRRHKVRGGTRNRKPDSE